MGEAIAVIRERIMNSQALMNCTHYYHNDTYPKPSDPVDEVSCAEYLFDTDIFSRINRSESILTYRCSEAYNPILTMSISGPVSFPENSSKIQFGPSSSVEDEFILKSNHALIMPWGDTIHSIRMYSTTKPVWIINVIGKPSGTICIDNHGGSIDGEK